MNRPDGSPPSDGVLWPTGPDTSRSEADAGRRAAVGDTDLIGSDEASKATLRYQVPGWDGEVRERSSPARSHRVGPAKDVRAHDNIRKVPYPCAMVQRSRGISELGKISAEILTQME